MKDFLDRLGRMARAELNAFTDKIKDWEDDQGAAANPETSSSGDGASAWESEGYHRQHRSNHAYSKEVREAYAALELPLGADRDAVKKAYREMLRRYHPDKHQNDPSRLKTATLITQRVQQSHETLIQWLEHREG